MPDADSDVTNFLVYSLVTSALPILQDAHGPQVSLRLPNVAPAPAQKPSKHIFIV